MGSGFLVAVCGIDGSAKTTQAARIAAHLRPLFPDLLETRQPTDRYRQDPVVRAALDLETPFDLVATELALFSAFDRLRHIREVVQPALSRGSAVVTDRYVYSAFAYFLARGVRDIAWLREINRYVREPDLTIYLDVPPELAVDRIIGRDGASRKREELDLDRMRAVRACFVEQPWGADSAYRVVDASLPPDVVWSTVREHLDRALSQSRPAL